LGEERGGRGAEEAEGQRGREAERQECMNFVFSLSIAFTIDFNADIKSASITPFSHSVKVETIQAKPDCAV